VDRVKDVVDTFRESGSSVDRTLGGREEELSDSGLIKKREREMDRSDDVQGFNSFLDSPGLT
jgi:hypothetical protein